MKNTTTVALIGLGAVTSTASSHSPAPNGIAELIKSAIRRAIKAVDLKIKRLQNKTVWLQNAQKILENKMAELKLNEISRWFDFYNTLYWEYFSELKEVKFVIKQNYRIREIIRVQGLLVSDYQKVWILLQIDPNFSAEELMKMSGVYEGILSSSLKNTDLLIHILSSFSTRMGDGQRLELINRVGVKIEKNYRDLQHFNQRHIFISLQRANSQSQIEHLKKIYGINPLIQ